MTQPAYGIMAEFRRPEDLIEAVRAARRAGYTKLDAFSPFPLSELADELGVRTTIIPWIAVLAALVGAGLQYGSQYWMNAVDYPLNVGGRPLDSWPAFIPVHPDRCDPLGRCRDPDRPARDPAAAAPASSRLRGARFPACIRGPVLPLHPG